MAAWSRFSGGIRGWVQRRRVDQELDDELRDYLEAAVDEKMAAGMTRDEARRMARAEMGSAAAVKDRVRDVGWESVVDSVWQDVRFALRMLRRQPAFTAAAVATLALGIGGTTAIFSVVDGLFLRSPDGVAEPSSVRKVYISREVGGRGEEGWTRTSMSSGSWMDYETMRANAPAFAAIAAYLNPAPVDLGRGSEAEEVRASAISRDFLQLLGVRAAIGRLLLAEEDGAEGAHPVALISYGMWQARFAGAADVIGRTLLLNGTIVEIVGVTEHDFTGIEAVATDVWLPSSMARPVGLWSSGGGDWRTQTGGMYASYVARLAPGAADTLVTQQAAAALRHAAEAGPRLSRKHEVVTASLALAAVPGGTPAADLSLWVALVAALVLIIACANVANLLLARAIARRRELAVRLSLGAGKWRVVRQHLTESAVLALLGGAAGVMLAYWAMGLMQQFPLPPSAGRLDARLLLFVVGVSLVTGVAFGVLPAVRAADIDPVQGLKDSRAVGALRSHRTRRALVVLQVSLSLALLVGAGLFVRSLRQVNAIDGGAALNRLLVARVDVERAHYPPSVREELYETALSRLSTIPGVERVAIVHFEPFTMAAMSVEWRVPGRPMSATEGPYLNLAGPGYFETAGTRLLRGRGIEAADTGGEPVAVVNDAAARMMAENGDIVGRCVPIGHQLQRGGCTNIVGVVETQRRRYLEDKAVPMVFLARAQNADAIPFGAPALIVRTHGEPSAYAAAVRSVLQSLRNDVPSVSVQPLTENIRSVVLPFRLGATLFSLFGALALLLAAVGLYGVLGYFVAERAHEIGIRRSLGAPVGSVVALVMRQGIVPVGVGLVLGLATAFAGTRYLESLLFGVEARDPASYAGAVVFLVCIALVAMLLPAWRAARVDAMVALRQD
jgi:putative ABC transport system permease protein